ncbi:MAG: hypothetical protein H7Y13_05450 [Sphingobacteriaceae bacterium]|nr:hypothetical protein [Sphingobacteriaceae bacterium]
MKTKNEKIKNFDTVKTFRDIKEKIAAEISNMNFEELREYLKQRKHKTAK